MKQFLLTGVLLLAGLMGHAQERVSLADFGGVGDGVTSNTEAIAKAIAESHRGELAVSTEEPGTIRFQASLPISSRFLLVVGKLQEKARDEVDNSVVSDLIPTSS